MSRSAQRDPLYEAAVREFGRALDRLAAGYEADPERRRDLRQEIHLQLWRSLERFDNRCSLKTWTFRVAHNTAVSYIQREHRDHARLVTIDQVDPVNPAANPGDEIDRQKALRLVAELIRQLKPLDRQIILCYLEEMDAAAIAEITGLSAANIAMKIHRIKNVLAARYLEDNHYV